MKFFLCVIGTVMILEGLPYFIAPEGMKEYIKKISGLPSEHLRALGLVFMLIGLSVVYIGSR